MTKDDVLLLAELVALLLLAALLAVDLWPRPSRRTRTALTGISAVLIVVFLVLVIARFVLVAG